jgi:hypothetical protein
MSGPVRQWAASPWRWNRRHRRDAVACAREICIGRAGPTHIAFGGHWVVVRAYALVRHMFVVANRNSKLYLGRPWS